MLVRIVARRISSSSLLLVNLVLGLFNLIPAFPMDGGRVLRALLSGWLGRAQATSIAASIGRVLALAIRRVWPVLPRISCTSPWPRSSIIAAGAEEAKRPRRGTTPRHTAAPRTEGIWTAPPGYRWVHAGQRRLAARPDRRHHRAARARDPRHGRLTPIVELGVAEAYEILTGQLGVDPLDLPPLEAIENEDWGRDLLLSRFLELPAEALAAAGVCPDDGPPPTA